MFGGLHAASPSHARDSVRAAIVSSVAAAALGVAAAPAYATPTGSVLSPLPPTLAGENLDQTSSDFSFIGPDNCTGGAFTSSGMASGPYSGSYTQTGSFTTNAAYGAFGAPATGTVTLFQATLTIEAADGTVVRATESLNPAAPAGSGPVYCNKRLLYRFNVGDASSPVPVRYDAVIATSGGAFEDVGTASATMTGEGGPGPTPYVATFHENFASAGLLGPTSLSQCLQDGWMRFSQFNSLGRCTSVVARAAGSAGTG